MKLLEIVTIRMFASKLKKFLSIIKNFKGVDIDDGYDEDPGEATWTKIRFDESGSEDKVIELADKMGFQHYYLSDNNSVYVRPFGEKIKPREFIYHTSDINNVESIMLHGLEVSRSDCQKWGDDLFYCNAIFATNSNDPHSLFSQDGGLSPSSGIIRINTKLLKNIWRVDLNLPDKQIVTYSDIPREALEYIGVMSAARNKNLDTIRKKPIPEAQDMDF